MILSIATLLLCACGEVGSNLSPSVFKDDVLVYGQMEFLKHTDPVAWASVQPVDSKPWRHIHEIEKKNGLEWTKRHGPRLVDMLRKRYSGMEFLTPFDPGVMKQIGLEEIPEGQASGVLFHLMMIANGKKVAHKNW